MPDKLNPGRLKTAVFSLVPLVALLVLCEAGARLYEVGHPELPADPTLGFTATSRLFVPIPGEPGRMMTNPEKEANFVKQYFLDPKPKGVFRVFAVGESSVTFLNNQLIELQSWLEKRLSSRGRRVDVINAGGKSYGSERLKILARELASYQPDLAILYLGNNEFEEVTQLSMFSPATAGVQALLSRLALFRVPRDLLARARIARIVRKDPHASYDVAWQHRFSGEEISRRMLLFRENLTEIIKSFQAAGAAVLIGTIPSNLIKPWWSDFDTPAESAALQGTYAPALELYARGRWKEGAQRMQEILKDHPRRHQSSVYENELIREVARERGVPVLDMIKAIEAAEPHGVPGETLYLDSCHLNPKGKSIWLEEVEKALVEDRLLPL